MGARDLYRHLSIQLGITSSPDCSKRPPAHFLDQLEMAYRGRRTAALVKCVDFLLLHIDQAEDLVDITNGLSDRISDLETALAVANDQMETIMGDHLGFADVLRELGEIGVLPSGERRDYGGYGNR